MHINQQDKNVSLYFADEMLHSHDTLTCSTRMLQQKIHFQSDLACNITLDKYSFPGNDKSGKA